MSKLKLLVPMDGTEFSRRIESHVRRLFPAETWQISLLHVATVPVGHEPAMYGPAFVGTDYRLFMYGYGQAADRLHPLYDDESLEEYRSGLEADLRAEEAPFREYGYDVDSLVHFGEPAEAIADHAKQVGADLVAMVSHHRTGLNRLLHGSVANRVVDLLDIPVLLLRVDEDEAGEQAAAAPNQAEHDGPGAERRLGAQGHRAPEQGSEKVARSAFNRRHEPMERDYRDEAMVAGGGLGAMTQPAPSRDPRLTGGPGGDGGGFDSAADSEGVRGEVWRGARGPGPQPGVPVDDEAEGVQTDDSRERGRGPGPERSDDEVVTPAATGPATLAGIAGRGVVTLLRNDENVVVDAQGSWFPASPDADLGKLIAAEKAGDSVLFEGPVVEGETKGNDADGMERRSQRARVNSIRRYVDNDGDERILVSFDLHLERPEEDLQTQLTRSEFEELSLEEVIGLTGMEPPSPIMSETQERDFREKAWRSYELDIEHRDEWGTARQDIPLPRGE